jgi:hypothetical protein
VVLIVAAVTAALAAGWAIVELVSAFLLALPDVLMPDQ